MLKLCIALCFSQACPRRRCAGLEAPSGYPPSPAAPETGTSCSQVPRTVSLELGFVKRSHVFASGIRGSPSLKFCSAMPLVPYISMHLIFTESNIDGLLLNKKLLSHPLGDTTARRHSSLESETFESVGSFVVRGKHLCASGQEKLFLSPSMYFSVHPLSLTRDRQASW